jgi:hypothetical protein
MKASRMMLLAMRILWPSFLAAILAEGFFFSLFDPAVALHAATVVALSPLAAYTIGFFFFWTFCALASSLTCYLNEVPDEGKHPL